MITAKIYGKVMPTSSCVTTRSVRRVEWHDSLTSAMVGALFMILIIDHRRPCRICGMKYGDRSHLVDDKVYDFSDWKKGDERHWFID